MSLQITLTVPLNEKNIKVDTAKRKGEERRNEIEKAKKRERGRDKFLKNIVDREVNKLKRKYSFGLNLGMSLQNSKYRIKEFWQS